MNLASEARKAFKEVEDARKAKEAEAAAERARIAQQQRKTAETKARKWIDQILQTKFGDKVEYKFKEVDSEKATIDIGIDLIVHKNGGIDARYKSSYSRTYGTYYNVARVRDLVHLGQLIEQDQQVHDKAMTDFYRD